MIFKVDLVCCKSSFCGAVFYYWFHIKCVHFFWFCSSIHSFCLLKNYQISSAVCVVGMSSSVSNTGTPVSLPTRDGQAELTALVVCVFSVQVVEIPCKGRGVVATRPFRKGEFVVEYAGDLVDLGVAKQREVNYSMNQHVGCYMYYFQHRSKNYWYRSMIDSGCDRISSVSI